MSSFKDKVIWITGASSGIGEALAYELARNGARLALSARREAELRRVAEACGLGERDILVLPFDLSDTAKASGFAAQVINHFGRIDILINNGGLSQRSEAMQTSEQTERMLMEVNFFAAVNLSKAVVPYMIRQKEGHIVVVSSIAGKFGFFLRSSYSAAKHALHGYFESLRLELEKSAIDVTIVCPGKINTAISLHAVRENGEKHGVMDPSHANAMNAGKCAEKMVRAIAGRRREVLIGGRELIAVYIKRIFPGIFEQLIKKQDPM